LLAFQPRGLAGWHSTFRNRCKTPPSPSSFATGATVTCPPGSSQLDAPRGYSRHSDSNRRRNMHIDKELDARGLNCPLPILKAKKALAEMSSGQLLKVIATDAGANRDFQAFAKQTGNTLISQETVGAEHITVLQRR